MVEAPPSVVPSRRALAWICGTYTVTAAVAAGFVFAYARLVCTFMCSMSARDLGATVLGLGLIQIVFRPLLWVFGPRDAASSLARRAYRQAIFAWMATGVLGALFHLWRYPMFEWGAHAKLIAGYGLLGAGVLAQAEYLIFEGLFPASPDLPRLSERLGRRLLESYGVFTVAPAAVMLMGLTRLTVEGQLDEARVNEGAFLGVFFVAAALAVAVLLSRSLQRDAQKLQQAVDRIGSGALDTIVHTSRADELSVVADGINHMAKGLREREVLRDALGRFTSAEVAERVIAAFSAPTGGLMLGGRRVEVTLLLADLRGFTALTEALPPDQLTRLLNAWFHEAVQAVHAHGGMVDKFIGDAVFAVFGLAGEKDAALAAVQAAFEVEARLDALNARRGPEDPALEIGVAVHTGEINAGFFGSAERLEFTVVGRAANEVARVSDRARAPLPRLLVSEVTAGQLPQLGLVRVGELTLKGVSRPVAVFGRDGLSGPHADQRLPAGPGAPNPRGDRGL